MPFPSPPSAPVMRRFYLDLESFGVLNEAVAFIVVVGHKSRAKYASLLRQVNQFWKLASRHLEFPVALSCLLRFWRSVIESAGERNP